MTTLGLFCVALLAFAALLALILFAVRVGKNARLVNSRPPWPMPGGPARPLWRERWDPCVPFPPDQIAARWDEQEAKDVAELVRRQNLRSTQTGATWFGP